MDYYDTISEGYDGLHGEEQMRKLMLIEKHLSLRGYESLLDVGCGSGISTLFFKGRVGGLTGIDPSESLVRIAEQKGGARFVVGRAEELPFDDGEFDMVISVTAIHNFSDKRKGLGEIRRVGKGAYVLTLLKKADDYDAIKELVLDIFDVSEELDDIHDTVFIIR